METEGEDDKKRNGQGGLPATTIWAVMAADSFAAELWTGWAPWLKGQKRVFISSMLSQIKMSNYWNEKGIYTLYPETTSSVSGHFWRLLACSAHSGMNIRNIRMRSQEHVNENQPEPKAEKQNSALW